MSARPTRLLMVTPWVSKQGGGVAEAVRLLAGLLSVDRGFAVEVLSVVEKGGDSRLPGWGKAEISAYGYYGPSNYRFSPGLLVHLLRSDADIVHVHGIWTFQCLAVLIWSAWRGKPYIVSPHGMLEEWILARSKWLKAIVSSLYQDRFLKRAAAFHVLTEKERQDVARAAPGRPYHLIPNFVERPAAPAREPAWWRTEFRDKTVYLYLGRIHDKKGWRELCDAWNMICAGDHAFAATSQLVFCGWVDDCPSFEATVQRLSERYGNALFAGPQFGSARGDSLAAADALILPSRSEGLPMVVLEAWAAGVPVIMTKECNLAIGFEAGAALEIGWSAEEIARGLRRFAALASEARAALSAAGVTLVETHFSASHAGDLVAQMYEDSLARSEAPSERDTVRKVRDAQ